MNERDSNSTADPAADDWGSRHQLQTLGAMVATAVGLYLCYRLTLPFLPALAWALALGVVFAPFQRWIESKIRSPNLAALISSVVTGLIVLGLATFLVQRLVQEAGNGAKLISSKIESGEWRRALEAHPHLKPLADWMDGQDLPGTIKAAASWMSTTGAPFVTGSVLEVLGLLLTFYLFFFFLRDRRVALQLVSSLSPFSAAEMQRLYDRVGDTIHATIYGTLVVSAVQGLLGGLMFWALGLPAPLLWGVVMGLLAVVPVLGAFVIWVPAALFLATEGLWLKALILTVWGGGVVGSIDNLLLPVLVGKRLKQHTVIAFISVVGGLIMFGASGLILGPLILAITTELLGIWRSRVAIPSPPLAKSEELSRYENEGGR